MPLPLPIVLALAQACAPDVAPITLAAIAQVESRFAPLAIGVNGAPRVSVRSTTAANAAARASALIAAGRSIDLGLAQINSRNLDWLGLSVEAAFDPCRNLAAAAQVLQDGYARTDPTEVGEQAALRTTLSLYNTGDARRGFANGYVAKVDLAAAEIAPTLASDPADPTPAALPAAPAWDVFAQTNAGAGFFIRVSTPGQGVAP